MKSLKSLFLLSSSMLVLAACGGNSASNSSATGLSSSVTPTSESVSNKTTEVSSSEEEKEATLLAAYGACSYNFMSAYPGYTFKQLAFLTQSVEIYDDNTYALTLTSKMLSGSLSFDPQNNGDTTSAQEVVDRGQSLTRYYGSYTAKDEEGLITLDLAKPTSGYSLSTGNLAGGAGSYVGAPAIEALSILVDAETYSFDYAQLATVADETLAMPEGVKNYLAGTFSFMSAYPGYTFKQVSGATQHVELLADNTYVLTVTAKHLSGDLAFDPENTGNQEAVCNDRGAMMSVYKGTYTSSIEEGLDTVELSVPTGGYILGVGNLTAGAGYYTGEEMTLLTEGVEIVADTENNSFDFAELK